MNSIEAVRQTFAVIPDVLAEHLESIGTLATQRSALRFSPTAPSSAIAACEARITAHCDGLEIGGAASIELAQGSIADGLPWEQFAAIQTWITLAHPSREELIMAIEESAVGAPWRECLRRLPDE